MPASTTHTATSSSRFLSHSLRPSHLYFLLFSLLLTFLLPTPAHSRISLPTILSNNAILQRAPAQPILYGWSTSPPPDTIYISMDTISLGTATVQPDGSWQYTMAAQPASTGGHTLQFVEGSGGGGQVQITNVKFGDVILCGGQSNMEMTLHASFLYNETLAVVNDYTNLHLFAVQAQISSNASMAASSNSQYYAQSWLVSSNISTVHPGFYPGDNWTPDWSFFSAVCYYTGKALYDASAGLVPIGLISGAYGGTIIEAWTSPEVVPKCQPYPYTYNGWAPNVVNSTAPGVIWGPMVHPLLKTQLTAIVWYQGESNGGDPARYSCSFPSMITDWRAKFNQPSLPFIFVLLTPYSGFQPVMWGAQQAALQLENVYAVTTVDAMDWNPLYDGFIHPRNKSIVGERAARWIQSKVWNNSSVATQGPLATQSYARLYANGTLYLAFLLYPSGGSSSGLNYHIRPTPNCTSCCVDGTGLVSVRLARNSWQYQPTMSVSGITLVGTVTLRDSDLSAWRSANQVLMELEWFSYPQCALYDATNLPAMPFSRTTTLVTDVPLASSSTGSSTGSTTGSTTGSAEVVGGSGGTPSFLLPLMMVFFVLAALSTFCFVYCWALRRHGRLCFCGACDQCEGGCGRWCRETAGVRLGGGGSGSGGSGGGGGGMKWGGGGSWRGMSDAELLRMVSTDRYD